MKRLPNYWIPTYGRGGVNGALRQGHRRIRDYECNRDVIAVGDGDNLISYYINWDVRKDSKSWAATIIINSKYEVARQINRDPLWGLGNYE